MNSCKSSIFTVIVFIHVKVLLFIGGLVFVQSWWPRVPPPLVGYFFPLCFGDVFISKCFQINYWYQNQFSSFSSFFKLTLTKNGVLPDVCLDRVLLYAFLTSVQIKNIPVHAKVCHQQYFLREKIDGNNLCRCAASSFALILQT